MPKPYRCPECGSGRLFVERRVWVVFEDGLPVEAQAEDVEASEPLEDGANVCRDCEHMWTGDPSS